MSKRWKVLLVIVAVVSFAAALSYPIRRWMADQSAEQTMEQVIAMRDAALQNQQALPEASALNQSIEPTEEAGSEETQTLHPVMQTAAADEKATDAPEAVSAQTAEAPAATEKEDMLEGMESPKAPEVTECGAIPTETAATPEVSPAASLPNAPETEATSAPAAPQTDTPAPSATPEPTPSPAPTPEPTPTVNRFERKKALPYSEKEKQTLDTAKILPQYRELYETNHDMVGWLTIPETNVDYPVVQCEDSQYYLTHDFLGNENDNGQIILDTACDPYTPSYNLIISGHNMRSDKMFSRLDDYRNKKYWEQHKIVLFDTLMEQKRYVVMAAFYAADYDVNEKGFRYNVDMRYSVDFLDWLKEVQKYRIYDTGVDAAFGDEFLTLTTCNRTKRKNGRFVVICRRIREGEEF